jgi:hypothetical protein
MNRMADVTPPDPAPILDMATITCFEYDPLMGAPVGDADRTVFISSIDGSPFVGTGRLAALGESGTGVPCNASGYWSITVPLNVTVVIKIVDNVSNRAVYYKVKIPDTVGSYTLSSLQPETVKLGPV